MRKLVGTALLLTIFGCSTAQTISDLDYSLIDIQKGISAVVPKGIGQISINRRTFTSKYFDPDSIDADRTTDRAKDINRERATVVTTILGDRRPYTVEVEVLVEEDLSGASSKKNDDYIEGKFSRVGTDKGLAKYFRDRLANYLARLERNKNLIDDFRPF